MKLVVLALAQNCSAYLPTLLGFIREISERTTVIAMVGENGSTDDTRLQIERGIATGAPISIIDTSPMSSVSDRHQRMALGRQMLLERAREMVPDADFVCVMDVDDTLTIAPNAESLLQTIEVLAARDELFAIASTSTPTYYDLLALRAPGIFEIDIMADKKASEGNPVSYYNYFRTKIYDTHDRITALGNFLAVSAFNGLCVYKSDAYYSSSYQGGPDGVCEHVTLNLDIHRRTGRQILVSDLLVVHAPTEHTRQSALEFTRRRAHKVLSTLRGKMPLYLRK